MHRNALLTYKQFVSLIYRLCTIYNFCRCIIIIPIIILTVHIKIKVYAHYTTEQLHGTVYVVQA